MRRKILWTAAACAVFVVVDQIVPSTSTPPGKIGPGGLQFVLAGLVVTWVVLSVGVLTSKVELPHGAGRLGEVVNRRLQNRARRS